MKGVIVESKQKQEERKKLMKHICFQRTQMKAKKNKRTSKKRTVTEKVRPECYIE